MTSLVRIHRKGQVTLPSRLRDAVGLAEGDVLEAIVRRGKIVLTPKLVDEYRKAQRRIIDTRLDESEEDLKMGRTAGTFQSAREMIAHMKGELNKRALIKRPSVPHEDRLSSASS